MEENKTYFILNKQKTKVFHIFKSLKPAKNLLEVDMEYPSDERIFHPEILVGLGELN